MDSAYRRGRWRAFSLEIKRGQGRWATAGVLVIIGLGRLGLLTYGSATLVPAQVYGWLGLLTGLALFATLSRRSTLVGRAFAGLGACVLAGLGADVLPATTSSLILWWMALVATGEAVLDHDC